MPELLLELFSEEIPARMQTRGAEDLSRLVADALAAINPRDARRYAGPRRIALALTVDAGVPERRSSERGPRLAAPEQALAGFLRKHAATREELRAEGEFWVLDRVVPGAEAAILVARELPGLLRRFPWPKSMRWGRSRFTWVRPLRRILCLLDGAVVPFDLRDGDPAHDLASSNLTEGHRFLAPGAFAVDGEQAWIDGLTERCVHVRREDRRKIVDDELRRMARDVGCELVDDDGLLEEVAGLVEWPVCHLGRIDAAYMDLPAEVMQVSMRVNQRYFALRDDRGRAAPYFAFAANIAADDGGAAIVAGNERVLRARFADARHFWDLDRTRTLASRVEDLRAVVFHAKLGTQYERALRLERIARAIAPLVGALPAAAARAGLLCKADLTTGMVGEFPELQGVMGGYYADGDEDPAVVHAIRDHYLPRGDHDVPKVKLTASVALADRLDTLICFFGIGEKPTGSGDPFALRRAALGVLRLLEANAPATSLRRLLSESGAGDLTEELLRFLLERLRTQWRLQGESHGALAVAFANDDDRIEDIRARARMLKDFADDPIGQDTLVGYKRAFKISQEMAHDTAPYDRALFEDEAETLLADSLEALPRAAGLVPAAQLESALGDVSGLRRPLDLFFDRVTVMSPRAELRQNRLRLLSAIVRRLNQVADFSKFEG